MMKKMMSAVGHVIISNIQNNFELSKFVKGHSERWLKWKSYL